MVGFVQDKDVVYWHNELRRVFDDDVASTSPKLGIHQTLRGVTSSEGVAEGVLATTGEFTAEAGIFCSKNNIAALTGPTFVAKFNGLPASERRRILAEVLDGDYSTPSGPQCGAGMFEDPDPRPHQSDLRVFPTAI